MQVAESAQQATKHSRRAGITNRVASVVFFLCALLLVIVIISVIVFIASKAFLVFGQGATVKGFFFGTFWDPTGNADPTGNGTPSYGAGGLILGSIITTVCAILLVTPFAIGTAVFFTEAAPNWLVRIMQPLIEIFTGIPSVVVGFLGLLVIVPLMQKIAAPITNNLPTGGYGWASAIVVLFIMVLPTTLSISIDALRAVPGSVREASLALGSTRWQMMSKAVLPAASARLGTAVVLGFTRAIGETLAVALGATKWRMIRTAVLPSALPGLITGLILTAGKIIGEAAALIFTMGLFNPANVYTLNPLIASDTLTTRLYYIEGPGAGSLGLTNPQEQALTAGLAAILIVLLLVINLSARAIGRAIQRRVTAA